MSDAQPRRILASVGAVAAGFFATFVLSVGGDVVMHATGVFPPMDVVMSDGLFVLALAYRTVFTAVSGFVTARLAPNRPMAHVLALTILGTVMGSLGVVGWFAGGGEAILGPLWYPIGIVLVAPPSIWAGAKLAGV